MDIKDSSPGLTHITQSEKFTTLKRLVDMAGPEFKDMRAVAEELSLRSLRYTEVIMQRWTNKRSEDELNLIKEYHDGTETPDRGDLFPELELLPDLNGYEGVYLDAEKGHILPIYETKARRMDPATSASGGQPQQITLLITDFFSHQPGMYREEGTKCAFLLSLMMDRALEWASAVWDADPQVKLSFAYFAGMIREVFEYPAGGKDISLQLMELCQGSETAADYAIRFRTLAAQSGWNDAALWAVFRAGLNPSLQAELACHTEATSLSQFVAMTIRLDNLRRQHHTGTQASASARPRVCTDYPEHREEATEPMQLGRSRLAAQGHRPRGQMRLCYNCGASGHLSPRCPERSSSAQVDGSSLFFSLTVPVSLRFSDRWFSVTALIDSGAAVNLIDGALVEELGIPTFPCVPSLRITAFDSQPIGEGYLTRQTKLLDFRVGLFHHEQLAFYITASPANPVILGFPWLRRHDP
ncbi:hypothetical protein QTP70_028515 [Hemibagrus guttatus]|uniref:CCHC-type domain-containing protein n=1 Tax=Hemibagrus guttatus TaxID=175788 RepID=A0AAE0RD66_9TELE|nr:hypothetical protein QTP70_028515 [Hemibagrus guttatus]